MAAIQEAVSNIPASGGVPINTITIWSGAVEDIPAGWALCDGQDGRPDLRGRFVLGAGGAYNTGAAGGSEEVTLTEAQIPEHSHTYLYPSSAKYFSTEASSTSPAYNGRTSNTTDRTGSSQPHNNMPPYYALCYIIKVSSDAPSGIEEYDTEDGWHVRKWPDGYVEQIGHRSTTIPTSKWVEAGSLATVDPIFDGYLTLPVPLAVCYSRMFSLSHGKDASGTRRGCWLYLQETNAPLTQCDNYGLMRWNAMTSEFNITVDMVITGRVAGSSQGNARLDVASDAEVIEALNEIFS